MSTLQFTKATRRKQKLKIGITGPSGAGKSLGALALAHQLAPTKKIAAIDTENGSLSLYGDRYEFDTLEIRPPYLTRKYVEAVNAAAEAGYEVLIIDSISHQWDGDGGILQRKEEADAVPGSNHWTNWGPFTKEHNEFRALLLNAPIHIIATMRSKMAYAQSESGNKKKIEKLGLQPIQREGMEYEFTVTFDLQMDHKASASKDRTDLFGNQRVDLLSPKTGKALLDWLETAGPELPAPPPAVPEPASTPAAAPAGGPRKLSRAELIAERRMPMGHSKGRPVAEIDTPDLERALAWVNEQADPKLDDVKEFLSEELEQRRAAAEADQTKLFDEPAAAGGQA